MTGINFDGAGAQRLGHSGKLFYGFALSRQGHQRRCDLRVAGILREHRFEEIGCFTSSETLALH